MKLTLNVQRIPLGFTAISDDDLGLAVTESRWQQGDLFLNGHCLKGERRKLLGEWEYRVGSQVVAPDSFRVTEYLDWRDG